ncbi:bifunctional hydroxymethylpyrimidine kinase/phosphomethylpyrimidine kinase [Aliivibrio fischeri]|uniref:bifunctional hydroxymethylpyrimidine kinase/phosphomethylpyrimidine kinase n=1 Tax=Aliivibrio fischeri TaxID=668 RepID=UPI0012D955AF|nr:bifunctional hydroxymethylpyrimidine kinase/phosphomethylpyrimidine kinase [Aliivibrio fischeri]MUH97145.1 bifunctional hydroxymethylpyrimidine kinase/phosphomethylpyrimidine kinase [Aliivibrio fischeri]MUI64064.1 bifunctional hydroxymethylpyrimidine kinase/phosphomethylpyrimidine kinase [Aliivibrio fischeri]USR97426.1 bifunctional hydroxymethylpyrimidine kinase/phosphomethylpyrimidine kinase [Aliivibrio fischeri ATCC 7744 = JCM 18803 = DSM 507]GGK31378.1 hydroxymethylpyrimidine/phosphomethy
MSTFTEITSSKSSILNKLAATPIVLTIAGSDSGGGAGIQADIKAISATGGYSCSVLTALTAQNTQGVTGIYPISGEFVEQQLDAVFSDLNVIAVKIGMLSDSDIIHSVAKKIKQYGPQFLVVDPVMVATSGDLLLQASAIDSLKSELLPLADVITPNLPEAAALINAKVPKNEVEMTAMINQLRQLGAKSVLLKGGHLEEDTNSTDLLILSDTVERLSTARIETRNTHGTGCTLSSAIASYLAQGHELQTAVKLGKQYITQAITHADDLNIGQGHGPVNHFFALNVKELRDE